MNDLEYQLKLTECKKMLDHIAAAGVIAAMTYRERLTALSIELVAEGLKRVSGDAVQKKG